MLMNLFVALLTALVIQQPPATTAQATAAALAQAATPAACVKAVRDYVPRRQQELRPSTGFTTEILRQVDQEKMAMATSCIGRFEKTAADNDLAGLAELYSETNQLDQAKTAIARALASTALSQTDRATALATALPIVRRTEAIGGNRDARQATMYPRQEQIVDELDASPAASLDQKFVAHSSMLGAYRGDDIDAGIIKHAMWIINATKTLSSEQRKAYSYRLISPYVDAAEAWAGQGMVDKALELLHTGERELGDIPKSADSIAPEIARLELVGTAAQPITAPRWLNAPDDMTELPMTGTVTLLEFTAHWCGPCRESYPGVNRLREQFGSKGFRVVMATRFWGYFSKAGKVERPLTAEVELERDKAYFAEHHLDVPVAIGEQVTYKVVDNVGQYYPRPDPNDANYRVGGIPQIQIIDKKGVIRRIIVGYDNANESKLAAFIQQLLSEK